MCRNFRASVFVVLSVLIGGCSRQPDVVLMDTEGISKHRKEFALDQEPDSVVTVHEVYDELSVDENSKSDGTADADADSTPKKSVSTVVVGRVGNLDDSDDPMDPNAKWVRGEATFKLLDPAAEPSDTHAALDAEDHSAESSDASGESTEGDHDSDPGETDGSGGHPHDHAHGDDHDCPFCAKGGPQLQTVVKFLDKNGKPIAIDARALFGFDGDDLVVIRGEASLKPGTLVIIGDGIFIRR